ncbi:putative GTP-binding protein P8A3.11c, mitochondrial [Erysiphe neolycopersici]|uniref:Putative GTP-binding protein P8A3.11c, mitochondrial n=1 Tax=Erysiphe neolycopersici TaxID=212602 RepID=A0A420HXK5_9PEZI|nr:putative GTP-binding protein P8A3.11c, mitochondrial [Erysiphe neolycopersici]
MQPRLYRTQRILMPFLYPCLNKNNSLTRSTCPLICHQQPSCVSASLSTTTDTKDSQPVDEGLHYNQISDDYTRPVFADRALITVFAGSGGHGCVSFVREKYINEGPPNGGDGGTGGNIYIQAVRGETSLHKLARRNILRAGRGRNGQGKSRGGERGKDVVIKVPVGTVVREIDRIDPSALEENHNKLNSNHYDTDTNYNGTMTSPNNHDKWILYPTLKSKDVSVTKFPRLPRGRKSALAAMQVAAPVFLDLKKPMETPILIAAGAVGGLGNPHFVSQSLPMPKYATKGDEGLRIMLELELKLLADVGLVGLPNAGKSTLLRALSGSRARVGHWAFTTLQPNIGTAVLDNHKSRPIIQTTIENGEPRTNFTIADIPGLIKDAHLDHGLGMSFLRHVERAHVLAFVIDLSAGDSVVALKSLWKEVQMYELMKIQESRERNVIQAHWSPFRTPEDALANHQETIIMRSGPSYENPLAPEQSCISDKPWLVVATKADIPETEENYLRLKDYLKMVSDGLEKHPSQQENVWSGSPIAIPVSAIRNQGTEKILRCMAELLEQ